MQRLDVVDIDAKGIAEVDLSLGLSAQAPRGDAHQVVGPCPYWLQYYDVAIRLRGHALRVKSMYACVLARRLHA